MIVTFDKFRPALDLRAEESQDQLMQLATSIDTEGLSRAIRGEVDLKGNFEITDGWRRLKALRLLGETEFIVIRFGRQFMVQTETYPAKD